MMDSIFEISLGRKALALQNAGERFKSYYYLEIEVLSSFLH